MKGKGVRPDSIKKFDLFYLAAIAIGVAQALLNYDAMQTALAGGLSSTGLAGQAGIVLPIGLALGFGFSLFNWFLVSRLRQGWARWVLLVFVAWRVSSIPLAIGAGMGSLSITGMIAALLQMIALYFLFRPETRAWFARPAG
ncbi:hypothetical protein GRI62_13345 [Erythrobacter arachoides]|uniref:Uncharacterized protein n=1 Tax=Aurantiacibacter arachoides TaxID=1850444 RepID=A0A845A206_9SPHN|nr:hypothetical protein [Aurantiacibacter arachoides]MXO94583.1 hypothetical protein [Aurantiacibacter arachoides]GGD62351.1 hypothetical protein GCM10011411_23220 [Aurantiacibacter arachoides]